MAEYIERKKLEEAFDNADPDVCESDLDGHSDWGFGRENVRDVIRGVPAADVAPVVHGRWEDSIDEWFGTDVYTCSKCRESYVLVEGTPKENLWHYCPNCGAKMNGGDGDAVD